jgi:hypothetical protein
MKFIEVGDLMFWFEDKCGFCGSSDVEVVNMFSDMYVWCCGCKMCMLCCDNIWDVV